LDSNGLPNGEPFVIQETNGNQQNPAIAQGSNQRYQLAWQDDGTGAWDLFTATLDRRYQVTHIQYDYDPLYRLVSADYIGDIFASYDYTYDAAGNMTAYVETVGAETSSVTRTFNAANQLVTSTDTELGTSSFTYDANGNLTQLIKPGTPPAGRLYYHYNQRNLLTLAEEQIGAGPTKPVAEFVYDGDGNRLQQIDHTGEDPLTTTYTNDIIGLSQVLVSDDGTTTTYNLFGLDLISQDDGTQTRYLLTDGLGSTRVEMVGNVVETTTTYEPYGKLLSQTGSSGTTYGYTGEQYDALTGLVYLRAHYYNPSLKLFLSRDPFPGYATLSISQNGYAYVHANPMNEVDPTGNCPWCLVATGLGYIYGVGSQTYHNMQNGMPFFAAVYYKNHDQAAILKAIKSGALLPLELIPGADGAIDGFLSQLIDNLANPCVGWGDNLVKSAAQGTAVDLAFFGFGTTARRVAEVPIISSGLQRISDDTATPLSHRPGYYGPISGYPNLRIQRDFELGYLPSELAPILQDEINSGRHIIARNLMDTNPNGGIIMVEDRTYMYAIDSAGNIRVGRYLSGYPDAPQFMHHSQLTNGANVYGAGELTFNAQGNITSINDRSGHYWPGQEGWGQEFYGYVTHLIESLGIDTTSINRIN
jgi:RHS repeat-associated protein